MLCREEAIMNDDNKRKKKYNNKQHYDLHEVLEFVQRMRFQVLINYRFLKIIYIILQDSC
jgi:hypothetical protein